MSTSPVLHRIEHFYDAVPRSGARTERIGPLTLFVREGPGWPYYARPVLGSDADGRVQVDGERAIRANDVLAVRERQRELGVPQEFEWVEELAPTLAAAAREAGLVVRSCPLLVLDELVEPPAVPADVRLLDGSEPDLSLVEAVAHVAFGDGAGTAVGTAGVAERDAVAATISLDVVEALRSRLVDRSSARVAAFDRSSGPLSVGGYQQAVGVAEIVGVATLPVARRRGLGAAVTARLAAEAAARGVDIVFLSAQDDDVARGYERLGFRQIATAGLAQPPATA